MANLTTRTELATYPASDDLIHIVDVSDTTDDAAGTSKKISIANLLDGTNGINLDGVGTVKLKKKIGSTSVSGGHIEFTSIPQHAGGTLIVESRLRGGTTLLYAYVNGDTTAANYHAQQWAGQNASSASNEFTDGRIGNVVDNSTGPSNSYTINTVTIPNYSDTSKTKMMIGEQHGHEGTGSVRTGFLSAIWQSTAAITSIRLWSNTYASSNLYGEADLFIEYEVTVGQTTPNVQTLRVEEPIGDAQTSGFSWSGLSLADYDYVVLRGQLRSDRAANNNDGLAVYFNGDTTDTNYFYQADRAQNATTSNAEGALSYIGSCPAATSTAGLYGDFTITIPDPGGSNLKELSAIVSAGLTAGAEGNVGQTVVTHDTLTSAITQIAVVSRNAATLSGSMQLFGVRNVSVGAVTYPGDAGTEAGMWVPYGPAIVADGSVVTQFDWTDIPQNGVDIQFRGWAVSDRAANPEDSLAIQFNGDTTATNYHNQAHAATNGSNAAGEVASNLIADCPGATADANSVADIEIKVPNYTGSNIKTAHGFYAHCVTLGSNARTGHRVCTHDTLTDPITSISLVSSNGANFTGVMRMYVWRDIVIAPGKHEIETIDMDGTTITQADFQNIPAGFKRLWVEGYCISDKAASTTDDLDIYFNNDTTATNYYRTGKSWSNTTVSAAEASDSRIGIIPGATAIGEGDVEIKVEGYSTGRLKSARGWTTQYRVAGSQTGEHQCTVFHDSMTAAINRLTIKSPADSLTGKLTLYGEL